MSFSHQLLTSTTIFLIVPCNRAKTKVRVPEAWELDIVALRLSLLSHQHPVQVPAAARAFAVMSDSHSPHLPHGDRLNGELVGLWERKDSEVV